ncbi:MAG TPA: hypothetical protein VIK11_10660 [Tepidiformaceae bacterium]
MSPGLGVHVADLPIETLAANATVEFTFRWREGNTWEGENFRVAITTTV